LSDAPSSPATPTPIALAAVAAWALPGLGHVLIGQRRRGFMLMIAIVGLYIGGLLIGGIDVIDRREDRLWYAAQLMAGPATLAIDSLHQGMKQQTQRKLGQSSFPNRRPAAYEVSTYTVSVGRVNEMGTLYCALAGLLNLLVIIDLAWIEPRRSRGQSPSPALRGRVVSREEPA